MKVSDIKPVAWLCELFEEDGSTRTQFVEQNPAGLNFNDVGEPSPYRTTPLVTLDQARAMVDAAIHGSQAAQDDAYACGRKDERERCARICEQQAMKGWPRAHAADCVDLIRGDTR